MQDSLRRVYLDNAATSWPKSAQALSEAFGFASQCGATAGRGAYGSALEAERLLANARMQLARLIGAPDGSDIAMCGSGTHALNAGLWGVLRPGDHVLTTAAEHNSVLRPLMNWKEQLGISVSVVDSNQLGIATPNDALRLAQENTRLIALGHASNVSGAVHDVIAWGQVAKQIGATLLLDASQTLGYLDVNVSQGPVDVLAAAGHKGLRGLAGTGLLYVHRRLQESFRPLVFGGTGRASERLEGGQPWPHSVEVGNLNMPGIVSLGVAAQQLAENQDWQTNWRAGFERLVSGLAEIPSIRLVGFDTPPQLDNRIPVVSLLVDGWDVHDLATVLDTSYGIEVRAGLHCAALVHRGLRVEAGLGVESSAGTLRLSPGHSTTLDDISYTIQAFHEILAS